MWQEDKKQLIRKLCTMSVCTSAWRRTQSETEYFVNFQAKTIKELGLSTCDRNDSFIIKGTALKKRRIFPYFIHGCLSGLYSRQVVFKKHIYKNKFNTLQDKTVSLKSASLTQNCLPYTQNCLTLHTILSPLHTKLSPFHTKLSPLHTILSPLHTKLSSLHTKLSPLHTKSFMLFKEMMCIVCDNYRKYSMKRSRWVWYYRMLHTFIVGGDTELYCDKK